MLFYIILDYFYFFKDELQADVTPCWQGWGKHFKNKT